PPTTESTAGRRPASDPIDTPLAESGPAPLSTTFQARFGWDDVAGSGVLKQVGRTPKDKQITKADPRAPMTRAKHRNRTDQLNMQFHFLLGFLATIRGCVRAPGSSAKAQLSRL